MLMNNDTTLTFQQKKYSGKCHISIALC